ncbi:hypothetical protein LOC68_07210 [Blastopirellula sp. JC732]|uniref:Carboxypeptidase regulatory-like domain-containing protein n=1 Tax=Blastopirellula sediminis TaxID=2894196 RepID=A0A9X1MJZ3_9BACT|nr:hypothetical protein [Blastopirellula sediminis]MCC9609044.1 hypothetical protein [Blastopirellula sediminis]MCC9628179.1 hypothetical protein [Blastopirellula sediminis]
MHKKSFPLQRLAIFALLAIAVGGGCSSGNRAGVELAEVTGVVTLDGKPVKQVEVMFMPEGGAIESRGITDDEGKFVAYYPPAYPGAIPGKHHVLFELKDADQHPDLIPKKYRQGSKGIEVDVAKDGPNDFTFELKKR